MSESTSIGEGETVDVAGPPDGEPIVFVHGTVFNRKMWGPQRVALADEYRVLAPDLPGHGARRDESFRLDEGVRTLERVVGDLVDPPVNLIGLSLGGYVSTAFAQRNPDAVRKLVLSGSSANPVRLLGVLSRLTGGAALLASKSDLVERAVDRVASWYVRKRDIPREVATEMVRAGFDLKPFGRAGFEIAGEDFRGMFAAFDGPSLVLNGRWDLLMRRGEDAHAEAGANAAVAVVDDAGHVCNLDNPKAYDDTVRRFLAADR